MNKKLLLCCILVAIPFVVAAYIINVILCGIDWVLSKITNLLKVFVKGVYETYKENFGKEERI